MPHASRLQISIRWEQRQSARDQGKNPAHALSLYRGGLLGDCAVTSNTVLKMISLEAKLGFGGRAGRWGEAGFPPQRGQRKGGSCLRTALSGLGAGGNRDGMLGRSLRKLEGFVFFLLLFNFKLKGNPMMLFK